MMVEGEEKKALWFEDGKLYMIDQRKLPFNYEIYVADSVDDVVFAIKDMVVRGAPAIGVAAAYGMVIGWDKPLETAEVLRRTRPTAYDLFYAIDYMLEAYYNNEDPLEKANEYMEECIERCRRIGLHGEKLIEEDMQVLTHCNAGALATIDYGTALAPMRVAWRNGKKFKVYADETRPRMQGLLTVWELRNEGIPCTLIPDNAAGFLMEQGEIDLVIVGADRIARNGDFANKIGTYEKAVVAKENNIPFYVAAPISTFDKNIENGMDIVIEERNPLEVKTIQGKQVMPDWINVRNPAFDVTPAKYVTGYITEEGVKTKVEL
ncbi:MAG TPA: S-methyl-5-thioribose-1-phosphate isomerase [Thermoplasmatales archaeon]|nr:S-methyl-5-thioribose-1-phosphate isomerase [Thermoplasmatales archaeon]